MTKYPKSLVFVLGLVLVIGSACQAQGFTQWATQAQASSSLYHDPDRYSPSKMLGRPDVYPEHKDAHDAWCPEYPDSWWVWLTLGYSEAVIAEKIEVYETFNPGAISQVHLIDEYGLLHPVWQGEAGPKGEQARIFTVHNIQVDVPVTGILLTLQPDQVPGWNQIDAVSLTGRAPGAQAAHYLGQWAVDAKTSTQYASERYAAYQMTGQPDVYPRYGDNARAWTPEKANKGEEWAELTYEQAVIVSRIDIYETCGPGAIEKVELVDDFGVRYTVWTGSPRSAGEVSRIFHVYNNAVHVPCRKVRLTLDTAKVEGWNEIDAVGLLGTVSGHAPPSRSELGKPATTMATTMATTVATTVEEFEELILQIESRRGADPWVLEALKDWLLELRRIGSQLYEN